MKASYTINKFYSKIFLILTTLFTLNSCVSYQATNQEDGIYGSDQEVTTSKATPVVANTQNQQGIDYIWSFFKESFFEPYTLELLNEVTKLVAAAQHRPINFDHPKHQQFIKGTQEKIMRLVEKEPSINFEKELTLLNKQE